MAVLPTAAVGPLRPAWTRALTESVSTHPSTVQAHVGAWVGLGPVPAPVAALYGGELAVGPESTSGFAVRVRLPLQPTR